MRIVHITNISSPDKQGGLERYVRELAEAQAAVGHRVSIIAKAGPGVTEPRSELGAGVDLHRYFGPSKQNPFFVPLYPIKVVVGVAGLLRKLRGSQRGAEQPIFHAHHPVPAIALKLTRRPYFYTFHAPVFKEIVGERQASYKSSALLTKASVIAMRLLEGWLLRGALQVHTLSRFVRSEAVELGVPVRSCTIIAGGLRLDHFTAGARPDALASPRLFAARRLVERTGVEELVEAFAIVQSEFPDARLLLSGTGPRRTAIEQRIEELGLHGAVQLLGWITDDELVDQYRAATISVVPTQYLEGFGLATAEALACGTPTVVTPVGANPELLEDLDPSLVAMDASPGSIARAVVAALRDEESLALVREKLRGGYASRWGWDVVVQGITDMYRARAA
jgi:glycosyltransferase involved in cell wall biosynthesis